MDFQWENPILENGVSHLNTVAIILITSAALMLISTAIALMACMLSSRISQTEEFVDLLVTAVNHQLTNSLAIEDHAE